MEKGHKGKGEDGVRLGARKSKECRKVDNAGDPDEHNKEGCWKGIAPGICPCREGRGDERVECVDDK